MCVIQDGHVAIIVATYVSDGGNNTAMEEQAWSLKAKSEGMEKDKNAFLCVTGTTDVSTCSV